MTLSVGEVLILLVEPGQIQVSGGITLRSFPGSLEGLPRSGVIPKGELAHTDVHEDAGQRVVQGCGRFECGERLVVPVVLLEDEPPELLPQGPSLGRLSQPLGKCIRP